MRTRARTGLLLIGLMTGSMPALGQATDSALEVIGRQLSSEDPTVRLDGTLALGRVRTFTDEAVSLLDKALKDPSEPVRLAAADVATSWQSEPSIRRLCELLSDPSDRVALRAARCLMRVAKDGAARNSIPPDVVEGALSASSGVRRVAIAQFIRAYCSRGGLISFATMLALFGDLDPQVSSSSGVGDARPWGEILVGYAKRHALQPEDVAAIGSLVTCHPTARTRLALYETLMAAGPCGGRDVLIASGLRDAWSTVRSYCAGWLNDAATEHPDELSSHAVEVVFGLDATVVREVTSGWPRVFLFDRTLNLLETTSTSALRSKACAILEDITEGNVRCDPMQPALTIESLRRWREQRARENRSHGDR